jgi:hypothetical protein
MIENFDRFIELYKQGKDIQVSDYKDFGYRFTGKITGFSKLGIEITGLCKSFFLYWREIPEPYTIPIPKEEVLKKEVLKLNPMFIKNKYDSVIYKIISFETCLDKEAFIETTCGWYSLGELKDYQYSDSPLGEWKEFTVEE